MQVNLVNPFKGIVMEVFMKIFKIQEIRFLFVGGVKYNSWIWNLCHINFSKYSLFVI